MSWPADSTATQAESLLRLSQVTRRVALSKSEIWRRVKAKTFPQPFRLSANVTVWPESLISAWISEQIEAARGQK